jgi:hypothetical protein
LPNDKATPFTFDPNQQTTWRNGREIAIKGSARGPNAAVSAKVLFLSAGAIVTVLWVERTVSRWRPGRETINLLGGNLSLPGVCS